MVTGLLIIGGGVVLPTVVLSVLLVYGLALLPTLLAPAAASAVQIAVSGEQWWWRVRYLPSNGHPEAVELANEIRLPVGERVQFHLHSPDVLHSFWIPSLGGKIDLIPGRHTRLALEPTRTGVFRGVCAEFCGTSHALMSFSVVVMEPAGFATWLAQQYAPAQPPVLPLAARGAELFLATGCGACHTVRGTPANGVVGPDLTHVGSRQSLGAGILPNDPAGISTMDYSDRYPQAGGPYAGLRHAAARGYRGYGRLSGGTAMRHDPAPLPQAPPLEVQRAQEARLLQAWKMPQGWRYWSEVNNTAVGIWYTIAACSFFLFGGVLALLIRIQLAFPDHNFLSADLYNQVFTLHGSIMMFLFAVPIFEAVSIMFLPQMLGARDLPFPRLSAYGFWGFALGGTFLCGSIFFDAAPRGGWFMYPPLTSAYDTGIGADIWLLGFSFIEVAAIAAAVELIVGVLKGRPPGMRINLMPLYSWYLLVSAVMVLFAFPPLIAGTILLELERAFSWPFFDAVRGGDPLLWQHLFWIFGHPEVYIIFLPAIALVAMIVPTFARTPMVGYGWIVLAAVGTGFLSFGLWVHHMFTTGLPGISLGLFSAASMAVAIPTGVQFFCFLATLLAGRVTHSVPLLYIFGGLATFVLGGLTGVMVAVAPFDFQAHDSFFVVAHLHSVLIGGTIFPLVAGFYYFFPLVHGKQLSEKLGRIAFWLMFIGFNVTFVPMHITGLRGMPRRVFTYPAGIGFDMLNLVSSLGAFILAAGFVVFVWDVIRPKGKQPYAARNPWGAGTLEWLQEMPGKAVGSALDSRNRSPLSPMGPAALYAPCRRRPLLPA